MIFLHAENFKNYFQLPTCPIEEKSVWTYHISHIVFLPIIEAGVDSTAGSIFVYSYITNSTNITTNIETAVLSRQVALGRDTVGEERILKSVKMCFYNCAMDKCLLTREYIF